MQVNFFFENNFIIGEICGAVCVQKGQGEPVHKNRPFCGLVYQAEGSAQYYFDTGAVIKLHQGDILYLPKGCTYIVRYEVEEDRRSCYAINFNVVGEYDREPFHIHFINEKQYCDQFYKVLTNWNKLNQSGNYMRCLGDLYQLISLMQRDFATKYVPKSRSDKLLPAIKYMEEHLSDGNISTAELAQLCGYSEVHFRRLFTQVYHISPKKFITELRIKRASRLLETGEFTVSAVSEMCGYNEISYFSKEFKRIMGFCPSKAGGGN